MTEILSEDHLIEAADGQAHVSLHRPHDGGRYPAVILFMDALGYRPVFPTMGRRLAAAGYTVLVPNLFYREGPPRKLSFTKERDYVVRLSLGLMPDRVVRDTKFYLDFLDHTPSADTTRVGAHGYCMGGGCALTVAAHYPDRITAAAAFHSARLSADPSLDITTHGVDRFFPNISARVYIGVAGNDHLLLPGETARVRQALVDAGVRHEIETYEGAQHGFAVPDNATYDSVADARHWERLLAFYRDTLQ